MGTPSALANAIKMPLLAVLFGSLRAAPGLEVAACVAGQERGHVVEFVHAVAHVVQRQKHAAISNPALFMLLIA